MVTRNATEEELGFYQSGTKVKYVIETRRGFVNRTRTEPGTEVEFNLPALSV